MTTTNPLAALAKPPHGIVGSIDNAAIDAAGGDVLVARSVVEAVEPLIVDDVVARIVRGATATVEWAAQALSYDGIAKYTSGDEDHARMVAESMNVYLGSLNEPTRRLGGVERAEVVRRDVLKLRDGSTLIGQWQVVQAAADATKGS